MENNLIVVKQLPIIEDQLRQVKTSVDERVAQVLALACTEATYKDVKKARAELNKEFQDLEARRREVKKAILAPYEAFEKLYKECAADAFTKADAELKAKIASVENGIKGAKREEIVAFYNEYRASLNIPEDIAPFERCGINITMSDSLRKLQGQASLFLQNVSNDLRMIETLEHKDEVLVEYRKSLSAPEAALIVDRRHKEMEEAARRRAASLDTIRKTSSELISGVEQQFKEICKERGISLEPAQPAQKQPEQDIEKLYMVDNEKYIHVQRSDTGIDYTIYDAASAKALDGGVLDDTGQLLSAAALTVCKLHNIGDAAPIRLAPLELLNGLQEANELLLGAGEQITGVEATSTADSLPDLPQLEQDYPMPDPTVDFAQMYQFGYTDGNTMLPLSKERARELFLQDVPIFVLNSDNTEYMVLDTEDLGAHSGIFGVERTEWESVRDTLQPRRDIVAPKQPDTLSYLHDDTAKTQPENYLKNAEMALEDNYGMIDGIINNAPKQTVAEQEERSSILAKLKAPVEATNRTEKHAPKRSAEKEL